MRAEAQVFPEGRADLADQTVNFRAVPVNFQVGRPEDLEDPEGANHQKSA